MAVFYLDVERIEPSVPHSDSGIGEGSDPGRLPCLKDILRIMKNPSAFGIATVQWAINGLSEALEPSEGKSLTCRVDACPVDYPLQVDSEEAIMSSVHPDNPALENCLLDTQHPA